MLKLETIKSNITFIVPSIGRMTLSNSIESLIKQTNPNWKCIIIFDGVEKITFKDHRIRTIKIKKTGTRLANGQAGLVRNEGIKLVRTEWIGFLDDDDTVQPNYVNDLFKKYSNNDFMVWRMRYSHGLIIPAPGSKDLIFGNVGISFCYKNKFKNLLFDCNRDGEDYDFLQKLLSLSQNYKITEESYYNVRG